jgi:hypothetical protein
LVSFVVIYPRPSSFLQCPIWVFVADGTNADCCVLIAALGDDFGSCAGQVAVQPFAHRFGIVWPVKIDAKYGSGIGVACCLAASSNAGVVWGPVFPSNPTEDI